MLHDDIALRLAYSAADAVVIPSRLDNLPNSGVEGLACGRPVVAFDVGGLSDIVRHQQTGFLAPPLDAAGLADGIHWVLSDRSRCEGLGEAGRRYAEATFSPAAVLPAVLDLYRNALADHRKANLPRPKTE
jgi:glycosyltransferase involved in cell wall biosynthesis